MAKKKSKAGNKQNKAAAAPKKPEEERVTMEALEAMSDSDDDEEIPESQWSTKAKNLRKEIEDGKFDKLIGALKQATGKDEEFEEDTLGSASEDDEEEIGDGEDEVVNEAEEQNESEDEEDDEEEEEQEENEDDSEESQSEEEELSNSNVEISDPKDHDDEDEDDSEGDEDEEENEDEEEEDEEDDAGKSEKALQLVQNNQVNSKALAVVIAELTASHAHLPWAETFHVIPATPLPFGQKGDPESNPLDIHDDLKREVAFYNSALEAVNEARGKCKEVGIQFSRPDDFFAEMVKTDDHMAKVKDRLIFETKKMEAVAQRKSNREQKLRAKESQANKVADKAKRKREHFQEVEEWANSAARNRGGALRDDADEMFLRGNKGPNKKRESADRKYGYGGKKGRFKQNDKASMNDVSGFNPRGNFPGMGTKKSAKAKGGSGADRPGKRAREAKRARR